MTGTAVAGKPTAPPAKAPTSIAIDTIYSGVTPPSNLPDGSAPYVIVKKNEPFSVQVSFHDANGNLASFHKTTALLLTSNVGALSPASFTVSKGQTSATLTASLATPANQVRLTVGVVGSTKVTPGTATDAQLFDVLDDFKFVDATPQTALEAGIGGDNSCTDATPDAPVCGVLILPNGATSSQVFLSLGSCDVSYAGCGGLAGSVSGSVVQMLGDLTGLYTKDAPAALLLKCDKTYCGTGAIQGISVNFSLLGNGALGAAPACPGKGTVGDTQDACVDYVESHRDGAGDSLLYLLFTRDIRGSVS